MSPLPKLQTGLGDLLTHPPLQPLRLGGDIDAFYRPPGALVG